MSNHPPVNDFLVEIGTEELPPKALKHLLKNQPLKMHQVTLQSSAVIFLLQKSSISLKHKNLELVMKFN